MGDLFPMSLRDLVAEQTDEATIVLLRLGDPRLDDIREHFKKYEHDPGYGPLKEQKSVLEKTLRKFPNITRIPVDAHYDAFVSFVRESPTRTAVFVASHVTYDLQLQYLRECISSLLNQTTAVDIYVSISYESKYESEVRELPNKYVFLPIKFVFRDTQTSQMNHVRLLTNEFAHNHKLIMFCDDDDTYEPHRVELFDRHSQTTYDGVLYEAENENATASINASNFILNEFWRCAMSPEHLCQFFDLFQTDVQKSYLNGPYADLLLVNFLKRLGEQKYCVWRSNEKYGPGPLYNYHKHNESVCVTAHKRHLKSEDELLLLYCCSISKTAYQEFLKFKHERVKPILKFLWLDILQIPEHGDLMIRAHAEKWKFKKLTHMWNKRNKKAGPEPVPKEVLSSSQDDLFKFAEFWVRSGIQYCLRERREKEFDLVNQMLA